MDSPRHHPDLMLITVVLTLLGLGLVFIYSSSAVYALDRFGSATYFFWRQLVWILLGLAAAFFLAGCDLRALKSWIYPALLVTLILLVAVLLFGHRVGGAKRWLRLGGLGFQPAELAKLTIILFVAYYCDRKRSKIMHFARGVLPLFLVVSLFCGLIFIQPDLGTPILIFATMVAMVFMAGGELKKITVMGFLLFCFGALAIWFKPYRRKRLFAFLNPWEDPHGASYQLVQSLIAIGSGGILGVGLGNSHSKLLYLPEPHTDFIFPILAEEIGLIGALFVVFLFAVFTWCGFRIAIRSKDFFNSLVACGITFMVLCQAILNIAMVTGCIPTKGLPLPFISFGGSSVFVLLASMGILLNISRYTERQTVP